MQPTSTPPPAGHHAPLEYHRMLLDDPVRMDAYDRALRELVRPGMVVLDLGCGTGILSMLAARRGARRVHAVEAAAVAGLAGALLTANGMQEQVWLHHQDIATLPPVEPVDLIVSDFMGRFIEDDGMLGAVAASGAWLRPGGTFCPSSVEMWLAPVADFSLWAVDLFRDPLLGLDLRGALPYALNYCYHTELDPGALCGPPGRYAQFQPPAVPVGFDHQLSYTLERPGLLRGVAGWFSAVLSPGVVLQTAPGVETHWGQYLFPLPPTPTEPGDELRFRLWLERAPTETIWHWQGHLRRAGIELLEFELESAQRLGQRPPAPWGWSGGLLDDRQR